MKRKVIKLGNATFVMSLPIKWMRKNQIAQGDYLEVEENPLGLICNPEKVRNDKSITIDIRKSNTRLSKIYLTKAYELGHSRIEFIHDEEISVYKKKKKLSTAKHLQSLTSKYCVGMEIISQSEKRTVIGDLGGPSGQDLDLIIQRLVFLLKDMAGTCNEAIQNNDKQLLESINIKNDTVGKFILYYSKTIGIYENGTDKFKLDMNKLNYFHLIRSAYNVIARNKIQFEKNYSKESLEFLDKLTNFVLESLQLCLKFDAKKAMTLISKREKIWEEITSIQLGKNDFLLVNTFGGLLGATIWMIGDVFGLDLIKDK